MDFKAIGAAAAAAGADQTKVVTGGGDFTPPAAGPCRLRFVSYIEVGKQSKTFKGQPPKVQNEVWLTFEVSGPKHPPRDVNGEKVPHRITLKENLSLNEKARFKKLFSVMNYGGGAQHMVQLLGDAYKGTIVHRTWKGADGKERIEAELYNKAEGRFTIEPPRYEIVDPENGPTGEFAALKVDPAVTPLKAFLWNHDDPAQLKQMWDSLYIDGEYPERKNDKGEVTAKAKSKNVLQNTIKLATNFQGSPVYAVIAANGGNLDIPDAEAGLDPDAADDGDEDATAAAGVQATAAIAKAATASAPKGAAADDALNGVV